MNLEFSYKGNIDTFKYFAFDIYLDKPDRECYVNDVISKQMLILLYKIREQQNAHNSISNNQPYSN